MKETAVEMLISRLPNIDWTDPYYSDIMKEAIRKEKEQIIDAQMHMFHYLNNNDYGLDYINKRESAMDYTLQYYNETYKTK